MVKPTTYFTLNLLLPLAIVVGFSSSVLAAQWVDANNGISIDLESIRRVSQGVYQYRKRSNLIKTSDTLYRNYYSYNIADCANQRTNSFMRHNGSKGDRRMHYALWQTLDADSLRYNFQLPSKERTPHTQMFILVCNRVQQNFKKGIVPLDLEPDWDLKPESYIEADEEIPRWP